MKYVDNCILAFKSLSSGKHIFTFDIGDAFFDSFENSEIEHGNFSVEVILEKRAALLEFFIKINGNVKVACDRCLDELELPVNYEGRLLVKFSHVQDDADDADDADDVIIIEPTENEIDLSQFLYDSINVSLPMQRVHPEDQCNKEMIEKLNELRIKN
ncbi:MAG: DUF177 domain-containing protein [Prevotellaceae bacterium]|jgi:uncharacterized metal-binding protein YceD (DUF177 family)|nr:DUF177 domain-containing protein [Prevotellaceae bacterium]